MSHGATGPMLHSDEVLRFGPFQLSRFHKTLYEEGRPVRLGGRALDLLLALTERAGQVVTKRELMALAWPNSGVEESNLRVHVTVLRKILGDGRGAARYIVNAAGRGYCFIASVTRGRLDTPGVSPPDSMARGLPARPVGALGRDEAVRALTLKLQRSRLVTIVGPAGIGKTTTALLVSESLVRESSKGVCFVDLSPLTEPAGVPQVLATALGVPIRDGDVSHSVIRFLATAEILIVIDNCEHVIAQASRFVEELLRAVPGVRVLVTSREPLSIEGEYLYRLGALALPPDGGNVPAEVAAAYPACQLFTERAVNSVDQFSLTEENVDDVIAICRRLDGIPLAIELVAARVDTFGVAGLLARLDDGLALLAKGRRTSQPRHQSLRAALDWSFALLSEGERVTLRRLAVFRGSFSLDAAVAIASDNAAERADEEVERVIGLAAKSLLNADVDGAAPLYRFTQATRAYAVDKLAEAGELPLAAERHAMYFLRTFERAMDDWSRMSRAEWLDLHGHATSDVRSALDWTFENPTPVAMRAAFLVAALPFGFQLSTSEQFRRRAVATLNSLTTAEAIPLRIRLLLTTTLGVLSHNASYDEARTDALLSSALDLALRTEDIRAILEPMTANVIFRIDCGRYAEAKGLSEKLRSLAHTSADPIVLLCADRASAQALHFAGDHVMARNLAERVLADGLSVPIPLIYMQTAVDRQVSMRVILARILWVQGFVDQARDLAQECLEMAANDSPFAVCHTLALAACPVAFWSGREADAGLYTNALVEHTHRYGMERWATLALCYRALLPEHLKQPLPHDPGVRTNPISAHQRDVLATIRDTGEPELSLRAEAEEAGWCAPELMRLAAERAVSPEEAAPLLRRAMQMAKQQRALSWQLRIALSTLRIEEQAGSPTSAALDQLARVTELFSEGSETKDRRAASEALRRVG